MGSVASKDGKGAVELPWRAFKSPQEQARVLPTFLACEGIFGVLAAASLAHAKRTGNVQLWFYGWMCGTANDALFMLLPFVDNFWHAQACVMLTPRLPLYIPGVYAVFTYASIAAARKFNLPYLQEAALAGLLSHLLYHAYDVNGPRFLWWTWHDGDPSVSARQENAPIGSSTWVLTYCAAHALLSRWVNDAGASLERSVAVWLGQRSGVLVEKLNTVLRALDRMHSVIVSSPSLIKIAFCGLAGTPLFMVLMGVFQVISFDKLGIPGQRTYRAILLAYSLAVAGPSFAKNGSAIPNVPAANRSSADRVYFKALAVYFVVQAAIGILGKPRSHVSTGCHQQCSDGNEKGKDIMGWERLEYMRSGGPFEHSRDDYEVLPKQLDGRLDAAGRPMITPKPDSSLPDHVWYTVVGTKHKNRMREIGRAGVYCVCGLLAYQRAFASSGGRGHEV